MEPARKSKPMAKAAVLSGGKNVDAEMQEEGEGLETGGEGGEGRGRKAAWFRVGLGLIVSVGMACFVSVGAFSSSSSTAGEAWTQSARLYKRDLAAAIGLTAPSGNITMGEKKQENTQGGGAKNAMRENVQGGWETRAMLEKKQGGGGDNAMLCIALHTMGGFGNKVSALATWLAVARVAKRPVAVSGPGVIWSRFWQSDFEGAHCKDKGMPVIQCSNKDVLARGMRSPCAQALFDQPKTVIKVQLVETFLVDLQILRKRVIPQLKLDYTRAVMEAYPSWSEKELAAVDAALEGKDGGERGLVGIEAVLAVEVPRILSAPTPRMAQSIAQFERQHALPPSPSRSASNPALACASSPSANASRACGAPAWAMDLAIHFRQCVDCGGWRMQPQTIRRNLQCMLAELGPRALDKEGGAVVFVTSDSRDHLSLIRALLPPGARVVEDIQPHLVHTELLQHSQNWSLIVRPYLDHYFLARSAVVASCWTSYAQVGALRAGGLPRLRDVIRWQHHDDSPHHPDVSHFRAHACHRLGGAPAEPEAAA